MRCSLSCPALFSRTNLLTSDSSTGIFATQRVDWYHGSGSCRLCGGQLPNSLDIAFMWPHRAHMPRPLCLVVFMDEGANGHQHVWIGIWLIVRQHVDDIIIENPVTYLIEIVIYVSLCMIWVDSNGRTCTCSNLIVVLATGWTCPGYDRWWADLRW
jgi:hypothetical protein